MIILAQFSLYDLFNSPVGAGLTMLALGTVFAIILLIASHKFRVQVDPKIEAIHNALPCIDCGACGYAGCSAYANALAKDPKLIGKCSPGGQKTAEKIADILNLQVSEGSAPQRPIVHCRAHSSDKTYNCEYNGIKTCTSANTLSNAQACSFGCLGYGDCVKACKFDALHVVDGLATVDYEKCTGCTACSKACPRDLITMVPFTQENMMTVACSNKEAGKITRKQCKVGCIACKLCSKQSDIFTIEENLAYIDYEKYQPTEENENALKKCPTNVIIKTGKTADIPEEELDQTKSA